MGFFKRSEPTFDTREIETVTAALETVFPHPSEIGS